MGSSPPELPAERSGEIAEKIPQPGLPEETPAQGSGLFQEGIEESTEKETS